MMNEKRVTSPKVKIRLRGLAGLGHSNHQSLSELTGFALIREGEDYVVLEGDPKLNEPQPRFLLLGDALDIRSADAGRRIAAKIEQTAPIPPDIEMPKRVGLLDDLGFLSRLDRAARTFFFTQTAQLPDVITNEVVPVMSELQAYMARTVTIDMKAFYGRVALAKLSYLSAEFGTAEAEAAIFDRRLLSRVLPNPFEPQDLFDAFVLFPPYAAIMPLHRPNCVVAFIPERFKTFDHRLFQTLPHYLVPEANHFETRGERATIERHRYLGESEDFLHVVADATNSFWDFFTRPLCWLGDDGALDQLRQLKGMSLARLLVSDVNAIQRTSSSFARIRLMFEFFDKFAALCVERHVQGKRRQQAEAKWASHLLSDAMLALPGRVFRYQHRTSGKRIFALLAAFAADIKLNIDRDLQRMHKEAAIPRTAESTADCIRLIRNFAHGTFLTGNRFEKQLLKMNPEVPVDAQRLPWLYLLAFALDPEFFLREMASALPRDF